MTIRCGCRDEADEIVFGPDHQCSRERVVDQEGRVLGAPRELPWETTLDEAERRGD